MQDRSYQQLSTRELEILQLIAKGYTNKEISFAIWFYSSKLVIIFAISNHISLNFSSSVCWLKAFARRKNQWSVVAGFSPF